LRYHQSRTYVLVLHVQNAMMYQSQPCWTTWIWDNIGLNFHETVIFTATSIWSEVVLEIK